jgi:hypothetical protein
LVPVVAATFEADEETISKVSSPIAAKKFGGSISGSNKHHEIGNRFNLL